MTSYIEFISASIFMCFVIRSCVGQRYWSCDPVCPTDCTDGDMEEPVCSYIQDVTLLAVSFVSRCHYECANKCYLNALKIHNPGDCEGLPPTSSEEAEKPSKRRRRRKRSLVLLKPWAKQKS